MNSRQKQQYEAYRRSRVVAETIPAAGQPGFEDAKAALDESVKRLEEYTRLKISGKDLGRAEARRRDQLAGRLQDRHMRKVVTIARAQIEPGSDAGLPAALRMPKQPSSVTKVLQAADAMIEAAKPYESVFVANGLPADFLAQFQGAKEALVASVDARSKLLGARIGARKGLEMQFRRARRAVDRLDAIYRAEYEGEEAILLTWRNAKRIQRLPGGAGAVADEPVDGAPVARAEMAVAA